jgi:hypothetical protein
MNHHHGRLRPIIEMLIDAQRSLTRALIDNNAPDREVSLLKRDSAAVALEQAFTTIESAYDLANQERVRLDSRAQNYAAVITAIHESLPAIVEVVIDTLGVPLDEDPRMSEAFVDRLNTAVDLGHAVRVNGQVRITYAGVAELLRAAERRTELETLKTEHFQAERRIHVLDQLLARTGTDQTAKTTSPIGARRAVGG